MQFVADLHLHSKNSRAVSQNMILPTMAEYALQKGLDILSASDFTHPLWFKEISTVLEEASEGLYKLKFPISNSKYPISNNRDTLFLLSTEIASIYTHNGKLRRIHNLVFAPSLEIAERMSAELRRRGCNLMADGRPIIGLQSKQLLELILEIDERCMLIPCHVWTPHFGVYGSASGYDSLEECFEELAPKVYGIETGISSDPEMNWRIPELSNRSILSFSDAHSPANMAREVTAFELEQPTYENMRRAIMRKGGSANRIIYTIEFYPEEGKYHFSGHRNCNVSYSPEEIIAKGTECPVCHRRMTEGVAVRIDNLAGPSNFKEYEQKISPGGIQWHTDRSKHHPPYVKLVRLEQIIGASIGSTPMSVKTKAQYADMIARLGNELHILLKVPFEEIATNFDPKIAEGIARVRKGEITIAPGFDGEYGKVRIWPEGTEETQETQETKEKVKTEQASLF